MRSFETNSDPGQAKHAGPNLRFLRLRKSRLQRNPTALHWLEIKQLSSETIEMFHLGLSTPYTRSDGGLTENALVFPISSRHGRLLKKSAYFHIPGVATGAQDRCWWSPGGATTYHSGLAAGDAVIIVRDPLALWALWQQTKDSERTSIICSSDERGFPKEWWQEEFWAPWGRVYSYVELPNDILEVLPEHRRSRSGTFGEVTFSEVFSNLRDGGEPPQPLDRQRHAPQPQRQARAGYSPVELRPDSYIEGSLYCPVQTLVGQTIETVVVSSNRELLIPESLAGGQIAFRLGKFVIETAPKPSNVSTWRWPSISAYLAKSGAGNLRDLLQTLRRLLKSAFWLPHPSHYALLASATVASFSQRIFDSVPLLALAGPPTSGKTLICRVLSGLSCNSCVMSAETPAACARQIDASGGFVFVDGNLFGSSRGTSAERDTRIADLLIAGRTQTSSIRSITDGKSLGCKRLDLFGMKLFTTRAVGKVPFRSQVLLVPTEAASCDYLRQLHGPGAWEEFALLRDKIHTWVFSNVEGIVRAYSHIKAKAIYKLDHCLAPLRAIAELAQDRQFELELESAISVQTIPEESLGLDKLVSQAAYDLVFRGHTHLSPTDVANEISAIAKDRDMSKVNRLSPESVGRSLRRQGILAREAPALRLRKNGSSFRVYPVSHDFLKRAIG